MKVVHEICCGIDVHAKMLVACLLMAKGEKEIRTFSTMTDDLLRLRDWLQAANCTHVAIESTGVYWKPVFNILEDALKVILINPEHAHALRGRKTDVKDAEWLADLLRHGLLKASFIPPLEIRELRELTRYRESLVREQSAVANRIQKVIESGNIKLAQVASDALGVSGRKILWALARGETDPVKLASLALGELKKRELLLRRALHGRLTPNQRFVLGEALRHWEALEAADQRVTQEIDRYLQARPKLAQARDHLDTIPGLGPRAAEIIVAEIGVEMDRFPSDQHLAAWAGMAPGQNETGGKQRSGKTRKGNRYLKRALVQAAHGAAHKKGSYLKALYQRLASRGGKQRAAVAVGRTILQIAYHLIARGTTYEDLGGDYFDRFNRERTTKRLVQRLEALGFAVQLAERVSEVPAVMSAG